jgi:hypothetical protein
MFNDKSDSGYKGSRTGNLSWLCGQDRFYCYCLLLLSCHLYHCLSLEYYWVLIYELMVTYLYDRMVNTCNGRGEAETSQVNGNPPPPQTLAQAITSILESHDGQTELLRQLVANFTRGGNGVKNAPTPALTTYSDFTATHPPLFTEAGEPRKADHWLCVIESKFGLLRCTEVQKTLFTA